eukprot:s26_g40.t1
MGGGTALGDLVERAELTGETIQVQAPASPVKIPPKSLMMPKAKAKSASRPMPEEVPCAWDDVEDPSIFELIGETEDSHQNIPAGSTDPNPSALEIRVIQMENALARVMDFLEQNHAELRTGECPSLALLSEAGDLSADCHMSESIAPETNRERQLFNRLVNQYSQELQEMYQSVQDADSSSRTLTPPDHVIKGEAPYRKSIFIERGSGDIKAEEDWEE